MKKVIEKLKNISGGIVLDVGTGSGEFLEILHENLKDYSELIGIDVEDKNIEKVQERFKEENIKIMKMDAANMEFEDNSVDTICISNTLHHLKDPHEILCEMKRVLKPGGTFIINEMFCDNQNEKQLSHVYIHHFSADIDTLLGRYHGRTYKKQDIIELAKKEELDISDVIEYTYDEEETDEASSKEEIDSLVNVVDRIVHRVKEYSQYEEFKTRGEEIKERLLKNGISGATELMVIGKKVK